MTKKPMYTAGMPWLNYHHFRYFWVVAREGSVARASQKLHLAQPTISGQIHRLEEDLGEQLFTRTGRGLVLTEAGRRAFRYAEEIFAAGQEFLDVMKGQSGSRPLRLVIGASDVLPKSIVRRLIEPAFHLDRQIQIVCREDRSVEDFLGELAMHAVDVVLADTPMTPGPVRGFNHLLGESGASFFAGDKLAASCRRDFPRALGGKPFLMPGAKTMIRRSIEEWFDARGIRPRIVAEIDDSALTEVLGEQGLGVFVAPTVIEPEMRARYQVQVVGRTQQVRQQFYAISLERTVKHPAVVAICAAAMRGIFSAEAHRASAPVATFRAAPGRSSRGHARSRQA